MAKDRLVIEFVGIDDWNRPIFKHNKSNVHLCSTEILFPWGTSEKEVKNKINETDLVYHGMHFDSEPNGGLVNPEKFRIAWSD